MSGLLILQSDRRNIADYVQAIDNDLSQLFGEVRQAFIQKIVEAMLEDPVAVALEEFRLSERDYYALRLARMLPNQLAGLNNDLSEVAACESKILIDQARHLMSNGSLNPFVKFGNDYYIANLLAVLKTVDVGEDAQKRLDDFLHRISDDACLHGRGAVNTLYRCPQYCFGFEFPPEFNLLFWKQNRANQQLLVPYNSERVIALVRDRFALDLLDSRSQLI